MVDTFIVPIEVWRVKMIYISVGVEVSWRVNKLTGWRDLLCAAGWVIVEMLIEESSWQVNIACTDEVVVGKLS
jgi:hypothetical protein